MTYYHWLGADAEKVKEALDLKRRHKGPQYGPVNQRVLVI